MFVVTAVCCQLKSLTLIVLGKVKVDLAVFYVEMQEDFYSTSIKQIPVHEETVCKYFKT
jgi:hypothetical protein